MGLGKETVNAEGQMGRWYPLPPPIVRAQFVEAADPPPRQDHRLERPDRPERHEDDEMFIGEYDALATLELLREMVEQQRPPMLQ